MLVKKEFNETNENFKNISSVLNNKKNAIARLVEINKVKNPETRKFMLNIYLNQLAEIEKKYDKSLIDYPNTTIISIPLMLTSDVYRKKVVEKIKDPVVKKFWTHEFEKMAPNQKVEAS